MDAARRPTAAAGATLRWPLESLWAALAPRHPGLSLELLPETPSTNSVLLERARRGDGAPCLLVAERQTAGRGRLGRPWFAEGDAPGGGPATLCFSVGLRLDPPDWAGLSLAVGVALAEALHPAVRLKWPNDLWLGDATRADRKLGGVLIETLPAHDGAGRHAVVGVGLNLVAPAPRPGLDGAAAGWCELAPDDRAPELLARIAAPLLDALRRFEAQGFGAFATSYAARDALAGLEVQTGAPQPLRGVALGVDARGALRLRGADGEHLVQSGDVSVRPC